jgi:hypothetical protein
MILCPKCSAPNERGQKFCFQCGTFLVGELEKFLTGAGLGELLSVFEANDIRDLEQLKALGSDDIKDLLTAGGSRIAYGDMIKLRKAIEGLKQPSVQIPAVAQEEREIDRLKKKASQGDVSAMYGIGEIYSEGSDEVEEDFTEAARWYRRAAEKGHANAQYKFGDALYYGRGVEEDERESAKWLRMAIRQGHENAKSEYNERLEEGRFAYLFDSAEQGNGVSQYRLGHLFYHGEQGHPVDKAQAASWLRKASAQGISEAQFLLGFMHISSDGIRQDLVEGRRLLTAAAAQGHPEAVELLRTLEAPAVPPVPSPPPPEPQVIPPEKKGKSAWKTFVGIAFALVIIGKIVAFFVSEEKKVETAPKPSPQSPSFGGAPTSSTAGIVNMGSPTPIPVNRPSSFSEQIPAPFASPPPPPTPVPTPPQPASSPVSQSSMVDSNPPAGLGRSFSNTLGHRFVPIPGTVTYFDIWDVRVADYQKFVNETGRFWKAAGFPQQADHPAVRINYYDAVAFCQWLTEKEHASGALPQGCEYRLPSDLEWSAAAEIGTEIEGPPAWRSGGIKNCYAWGSSWPPPPGCGNYDPKLKTDKYPYTSPVGAFSPNRLGLFDMNGNVYQWVKDDYDQGGEGCLRGGSWPDEAEDGINLTNRLNLTKDANFKCFGMRCVIAPIGTESRISTSKLP